MAGAGAPILISGLSATPTKLGVASVHDEVMKIRHVPEHRDEGTQQHRFSSGSILAS